MLLLWEQLDDKSDLYQMLISQTKSDIYTKISDAALNEAFCIDDIDTAEEVDIEKVSVVDINDIIIVYEWSCTPIVHRGIAETVPQLSISQRFAIIIRIAMAADKKSKVELLQPYRPFHFISTS